MNLGSPVGLYASRTEFRCSPDIRGYQAFPPWAACLNYSSRSLRLASFANDHQADSSFFHIFENTISPLHRMLECAVSSSELEELDPNQLDLLVGFGRLRSITGASLVRVLMAQPLGLGIWQYKVTNVVAARTRLSGCRPPFHLPWFSHYVQLFSTLTLVSSPHCHKSCFAGGTG